MCKKCCIILITAFSRPPNKLKQCNAEIATYIYCHYNIQHSFFYFIPPGNVAWWEIGIVLHLQLIQESGESRGRAWSTGCQWCYALWQSRDGVVRTGLPFYVASIPQDEGPSNGAANMLSIQLLSLISRLKSSRSYWHQRAGFPVMATMRERGFLFRYCASLFWGARDLGFL